MSFSILKMMDKLSISKEITYSTAKIKILKRKMKLTHYVNQIIKQKSQKFLFVGVKTRKIIKMDCRCKKKG